MAPRIWIFSIAMVPNIHLSLIPNDLFLVGVKNHQHLIPKLNLKYNISLHSLASSRLLPPEPPLKLWK